MFRELQNQFKKPIQTRGGYNSSHKCGKSPSYPASQQRLKAITAENLGIVEECAVLSAQLMRSLRTLENCVTQMKPILGTMTYEDIESPWMANIDVNGRKVAFKVDTGADLDKMRCHWGEKSTLRSY